MEGRGSSDTPGASMAGSTASAPRPYTFYYDGECGFCTRACRLLAACDLRRRVRWVAFQSLEALPGELTVADFRREAYLQHGEALEGGFYAVRRLTLVLPALWPLAPLAWFPGADRPGRAAYAWVARNRWRLPGSVCSVGS